MEIQGRVKLVGETQTFGASGFQRRDLVIITEEQYPQTVLIEFHQANCSLLDNVKENQWVRVTFFLRGREWTSPQGEVRYFNSLVGSRIEFLSFEVESPGGAPMAQTPKATPENAFEQQPPKFKKVEIEQDPQEDDDDDLPF